MTTYTITNGNGKFGESGPWTVKAETREQAVDWLTAEMAPTFRRWAVEAWDALAPEDRDEDREVWIGQQVDEMSADFAAGMEVESL